MNWKKPIALEMINILVSLKASLMLTEIYMTKQLRNDDIVKTKKLVCLNHIRKITNKKKLIHFSCHICTYGNVYILKKMLICMFKKFVCIMHNPSLYKMDQINKLDF
jgi:hypothetical protein